MPKPLACDYEREYKNFKLAKRIDHTIRQGDFADGIGVQGTTLSTHFSELRDKAEKREIKKLIHKIAAVGFKKIDSSLVDIEPESIGDLATLSKIAFAAADRMGFSPQAITLQVNQAVQTNVTIPPLLAVGEESNLSKLLGDE